MRSAGPTRRAAGSAAGSATRTGAGRPLVQPGRFTELFFLDEATAFAAGHRPCALCRRADYERFLAAGGFTGADDADARLHAERLDGRARRTHRARHAELPDGAFVLEDDAPWLVRGDALLRWTPAGYTDRTSRPGGAATLLTPPTLTRLLAAGWQGAVPLLHPSAAQT